MRYIVGGSSFIKMLNIFLRVIRHDSNDKFIPLRPLIPAKIADPGTPTPQPLSLPTGKEVVKGRFSDPRKLILNK